MVIIIREHQTRMIVTILFQDRLFLVMEFVSGGELMSLIVKERGFGEKRSCYASQFNQTAINTITCILGSKRILIKRAILDLNLEEVLGETKGPPRV